MSVIEKPELIDKEQLEFVYDNAINSMKYIVDSRRIVSARCLILLSYIALIIAGCANEIIRDRLTHISSYVLLIPTVYYILVFSFIIDSISLTYAAIPYDTPSNLLDKDILGKDVHELKFHVCFALQERIDSNQEKTKKMFKNFRLATNLSFLFIPKIISFFK